MPATLACPRCSGTMVRGRDYSTFSGTRSDGMAGSHVRLNTCAAAAAILKSVP